MCDDKRLPFKSPFRTPWARWGPSVNSIGTDLDTKKFGHLCAVWHQTEKKTDLAWLELFGEILLECKTTHCIDFIESKW